VIDLIAEKAYEYKDYTDKELKEVPVPEDMKDQVAKYRQELIEKAVEIEDELMEKYLSGEELTEQEVKRAVRKSVLTGKFYPILGGDGRGVIVETILDAVTDFLPSPIEVSAPMGEDPKTGEEVKVESTDDGSFAALAFKIAADPFVGKLAFFRVYRGKLESGSYILNVTTGTKERIGRILRMHANFREEVKEVFAGEIAAAVGLKGTTTGDTLSDPNHPFFWKILFSLNLSSKLLSSRKQKPIRKR
jgi:elongation factor G